MALRTATLAVGLSVALLAGLAGRALADGPRPDPAPPPPVPSFRPDPAPSAQQGPTTTSSRSAPVQRSAAVVVTPTTNAVAQPRPAAAKLAARAHARKTPPRRVATTGSSPAHAASTSAHRFVRFPGLFFGRSSFRAIGVQAAAAFGSHESRLLLAGGLALVLLVIGETTFLALAGARLGLQPIRRPTRQRKAA
jgi:hypothetical protein